MIYIWAYERVIVSGSSFVCSPFTSTSALSYLIRLGMRDREGLPVSRTASFSVGMVCSTVLTMLSSATRRFPKSLIGYVKQGVSRLSGV